MKENPLFYVWKYFLNLQNESKTELINYFSLKLNKNILNTYNENDSIFYKTYFLMSFWSEDVLLQLKLPVIHSFLLLKVFIISITSSKFEVRLKSMFNPYWT
jgi:hypothetical protein